MAEVNTANCNNYPDTGSFSIEQACASSNLHKNLRAVVESHPDEDAKNFGMSIVYLLGGKPDKMLECLEFLERAHPDIPLINRRIAEIYIDRSDYEKAISHLDKVLKADENDLTAMVWLSLSYYVVGDEKKAKFCFDLLKENVFLLRATNDAHTG